MAMPMKTKQIEQILQVFSAYPKDVVDMAIEAWRTGERKSGEMLKYTIDFRMGWRCEQI